MPQALTHVALVVRDYDEALAYFIGILGFHLVEDTDRGGGKRWVVVAPPGARETTLLLARATTPAQETRIGDQTGGRVFEPYGTVAVFADLYGNRWDLIERGGSPASG